MRPLRSPLGPCLPLVLCCWLASAAAVLAQPAAPPQESPARPADPDGGTPEALTGDGAVAGEDAAAPASEPGEAAAIEAVQPRGDTPVSAEAVMNPEAAPSTPAPTAPEVPAKPGPGEPTAPTPPKQPCDKPPCPGSPAPAAPAAAPLVVWANAGFSSALGPGRCDAGQLEGAELARKLGSTLVQSAAVGGLGIAPAGALGDHPLIAHAASRQPELLADLLASAGFSALALGIADLNGPLARAPQLSAALERRGVRVVATNLSCGELPYCKSWATGEDPLPIFERAGRRYALISVLPDDTLARVEPSAGLAMHSAAETLVSRTEEARAAGVELIVASIDHGPDASASANLASFLADLPPEVRPDLLLSPSSADNLLFMRPLDVVPAIVGTRSGVLTGIRVTKLEASNDADVFARSVRLGADDPAFAARLAQLAADYCRARGTPLPGGKLVAPLGREELVELSAAAARERAGADLAVVDPLVFEAGFSAPAGMQLQRGQMEHAVVLDAPLVAADVTLDWLSSLNKQLAGLRPLTLLGTSSEAGAPLPLIAGRISVPGALYRIVTTSVLSRSGRLPEAGWIPLDGPASTLRGALLAHLAREAAADPRATLTDPAQRTQWLLRSDGQIQANLTAVDTPDDYEYEEPALQVNNSRQLGARLLINFDADAPGYLFENALQIAFDRNFATGTTAQDLVYVQSTYTYRDLWPGILLYPHPFVEGYVETQFEQGNLSYHHLLLRPEAGLRSMLSRVLSLKLSGGLQYEVFDPNGKIHPVIGAELVLRPSNVALSNATVQLEGSVTYYWNAPGVLDQHMVRGQLVAAVQIVGPLQFTLTTLAALRKDGDHPTGKGLGIQAGVRLRFVHRGMSH